MQTTCAIFSPASITTLFSLLPSLVNDEGNPSSGQKATDFGIACSSEPSQSEYAVITNYSLLRLSSNAVSLGQGGSIGCPENTANSSNYTGTCNAHSADVTRTLALSCLSHCWLWFKYVETPVVNKAHSSVHAVVVVGGVAGPHPISSQQALAIGHSVMDR
jgi:hypothetical protein